MRATCNIRNKEDSVSLSHLSDTGKCHVMTQSWGEFTSCCINKTQAKRLVRWLQRWIEFKERGTL